VLKSDDRLAVLAQITSMMNRRTKRQTEKIGAVKWLAGVYVLLIVFHVHFFYTFRQRY